MAVSLAALGLKRHLLLVVQVLLLVVPLVMLGRGLVQVAALVLRGLMLVPLGVGGIGGRIDCGIGEGGGGVQSCHCSSKLVDSSELDESIWHSRSAVTVIGGAVL